MKEAHKTNMGTVIVEYGGGGGGTSVTTGVGRTMTASVEDEGGVTHYIYTVSVRGGGQTFVDKPIPTQTLVIYLIVGTLIFATLWLSVWRSFADSDKKDTIGKRS